MSVFIATWNLNLSTNIDPDMLTRFLVERNKTKCDVYALGAQEIPVEGIVEWEVMLQRCLGTRNCISSSNSFLRSEVYSSSRCPFWHTSSGAFCSLTTSNILLNSRLGSSQCESSVNNQDQRRRRLYSSNLWNKTCLSNLAPHSKFKSSL